MGARSKSGGRALGDGWKANESFGQTLAEFQLNSALEKSVDALKVRVVLALGLYK